MRRGPGVDKFLSACSVARSGTTTGDRRFSCLAHSGNMVKHSRNQFAAGMRKDLGLGWKFLGEFLRKFLWTRRRVGVCGGETLHDFRPILQLMTHLVKANQKDEVSS